MKAFLVSVAVFCVVGILLSVFAYATGNLPTPDHIRPIVQTDPDCSPCEENLKQLIEAMERWERERKAQAVAASNTQ